MRAGATCYLAVNVDGGLFSVGDGHYRQGEGEACGTAVEGAMDHHIHRGADQGRAPGLATAGKDDHRWMVGFEPSARGCLAGGKRPGAWMGELYGLHMMDAYQLLSQVAEAPLANVVDANYSVASRLRRRCFRRPSAYDGIHRRLRERAAIALANPLGKGFSHGPQTLRGAVSW